MHNNMVRDFAEAEKAPFNAVSKHGLNVAPLDSYSVTTA